MMPLHVCVKERLADVQRSCPQVFPMPRFKGGIGRTGKKHKKVANFDIHRLIKTELVKESSCSVHEAAATNEAELEEAAAVPSQRNH